MKIVLVDQSIKSSGGHHLEYAVRCLNHCSDFNSSMILAVSKAYDFKEEIDATIIPSFTHTFWENITDTKEKISFKKYIHDIFNELKSRINNFFSINYYNFLFSRFGLSYRRSTDISVLNDDLSQLVSSDISKYKMSKMEIFLFKLAKRIAGGGAAFFKFFSNSTSAIKNFLSSNRVIIGLANITKVFLKFLLFSIFGILGLFGGVAFLPFILWSYLRNKKNSKHEIFKNELKNLIKNSKLEVGDCIFIPTLGEVELLASAELCKEWDFARKLKWRFVFRRNLFSGRSPSYSKQNDLISTRRARLAFHVANKYFGTSDYLYLTDTEELTKQYNIVSSVKFKTGCVPIPEFGNIQKNTGEGKIKITYLGDARDEKNFGILPSVLNILHTYGGAGGHCQFVIQSNFNIKNGEPESASAKLQLSAMPLEYCKLAGGPFSSDEYSELLLNSDIVIIPYNPEQYAARSSGVLAEAIGAGKPVVTTGGSWMATVLEPLRQAYLEGVALGIQKSKEIKKYEEFEFSTRKNDFTLGEILKNVQILSETNYIFTTIDFPVSSGKDNLKLVVTWYNEIKSPIGQTVEIIQISSNTLRVLTRIPKGVFSYTLSINALDVESTIVPAQVIIKELYSPTSIPCGFGGIISGVDDFSFAMALIDVIDNINHYRVQSVSCQPYWSEFHSAKNMLNQIIDYSTSTVDPTPKLVVLAKKFGQSLFDA